MLKYFYQISESFNHTLLGVVTYSRLFNTEFNPFPQKNILDSSKLKYFMDNNSKLDENAGKVILKGRKHCGKRRNSSFRAIFLLLPQCFQKTFIADM